MTRTTQIVHDWLFAEKKNNEVLPLQAASDCDGGDGGGGGGFRNRRNRRMIRQIRIETKQSDCRYD